MGNKDRLNKLEREQGGCDEIRVSLNWCEPGFVIDEDTGEEVTIEEWKRRHPGDRLIVVKGEDEHETKTIK